MAGEHTTIEEGGIQAQVLDNRELDAGTQDALDGEDDGFTGELLARLGLEPNDQADDDEGDPGEPGNDGADTPPAIKIGDTELPVAEVEAAWNQHQEWRGAVEPLLADLQQMGLEGAQFGDVVEAAKTHAGYIQAFNSGGDNAIEVINTLTESAIELFGADVEGKIEPIDASLLDPAQMEPTALRIYAALKVAQKENQTLRQQVTSMADEGKELINRVTELEQAPLLAEHASQIAGKPVTGPQIKELITKYSLPFTKEGAANAIRLANLDAGSTTTGKKPDGDQPTGEGADPQKGGKLPPGAQVPKSGADKVVDMTGLTIEETNHLLRRGFVHQTGAGKPTVKT